MAVIGFLITLSILVLVHEWGHYIVARWCGVKAVSYTHLTLPTTSRV